MQPAATTTATRRRWFRPAGVYTAVRVPCLVALEWLVVDVRRRRIDAACDSEAEQDWVVWALVWLAAPMAGMRAWLLSGEPPSGPAVSVPVAR